jgi:hypothetical protein
MEVSGGGESTGHVVLMTRSGPLCVLSPPFSAGVATWAVKEITGNSAIEFGVVKDSPTVASKDDSLHRHGKVGISSSQTGGSVLGKSVDISKKVVEVVVDMTAKRAIFKVGKKEVRSQLLSELGWSPGEKLRLAVTLWSGSKITFKSARELGGSSAESRQVPCSFCGIVRFRREMMHCSRIHMLLT